VTKDNNVLFDSNRRHIKSGHKFSHDASKEFLESVWNRSKRLSPKPWSRWERSRQSRINFSHWNRETTIRARKGEDCAIKKMRQLSERFSRCRKTLTLDLDFLTLDFIINHDIWLLMQFLRLRYYLSSIVNNTPATTQAVHTVRASLSKPCFWKMVGIEACHVKQTSGDKKVIIQNKAAVSLDQEEDVEKSLHLCTTYLSSLQQSVFL